MNKITISGIAVKEGISRNKRKYIGEELEKFAPTLLNRPILKDHEGVTDNVIGKITKVDYNPETTEVRYSGWIKEDGTGIIDKIKDRRINEVSIGAIAGKVVKENKDDDIIIPTDMEALELSTTPVPGNKGTSLEIEKINFDEKVIKQMIDDYNKEKELNLKNAEKEDKVNMTNENQVTENFEEKFNALQEEIKALKETNEVLAKEKAELEESRRQDALSKYNELCEVKGIKSRYLSESTMDKIKFAIEMVEDLPEPEEEKKEEEKEEVSESVEEEEKPIAEPQSEDSEEDEEVEEESFKGFKLTRENVSRGFAFYKDY